MDVFYACLGIICVAVGFLGTVMPVLPGIILAWIGLFVAHFSRFFDIGILSLVIAGTVASAAFVLDSVLPGMFAKKSGGSKYAEWGSAIGVFLGSFGGVFLMVAGAFLGAFVGEMIHDSSSCKNCMKTAFGAFKGFLCGTGIKIISVLIDIAILVSSASFS